MRQKLFLSSIAFSLLSFACVQTLADEGDLDLRDHPDAVPNTYGIPITTSPYMGVRNKFDASHMIVNIPSINEDLRILRYRVQAEEFSREKHIKGVSSPVVTLSGRLEADVNNLGSFTTSRTSDIDLTTTELDMMMAINQYMTGYIALKYDNGNYSAVLPRSRTAHSLVYVDKGFMTLGHLDQTPWYATIGQFFLPFGRYSSNMISAPLPLFIGRVKERAVLLGYAPYQGAVQASAFIYRGDTTPNGVSRVQEGGFNFDYIPTYASGSGKVGVSYSTNIANSELVQNSGGSFPGFSAGFQTIAYRVPAIDFHAHASYQKFAFITEYVRALRSFAANDLAYLGNGARPSAFNLEGSYSFDIQAKPSSIALGYGFSNQSSAFGLPKTKYLAAFNTSLLRHTIQSLELSHAVNYPTTVSMSSNGNTYAVTGSHSANSVVARLGIYF